MQQDPNMTIIGSEASPHLKVEVLQYEHLEGSDDLIMAEKLFFAHQAGVRLKQIRLILNAGEVLIEPGALNYMYGQLSLTSSATHGQGMRGLGRALMRKFASGETLFQTRLGGTGEIYLDPTFSHFVLYYLENETLIVDKDIFYCADANLDVSAVMQKNISSALFGGEGFFQTMVSGTGIAAFLSPVPPDELKRYDLDGQSKLYVDGNFALIRTGDVTFRAEKSSKSLFRTFASGELMLQTFEGKGSVWIAPTQNIYEDLKQTGMAGVSNPGGSAGAQT